MPSITETGNLVAHYAPSRYSQSELLQQVDQEVVGGVCFMLCVYWILHHKTVRSTFGNKKPTGVRIDFLKQREKFLTICRGQNEFLREHGQSRVDPVNLEKAEAQKYGVTLTDAGTLYTGGNYRGMSFDDRADKFEKSKFMASLLGPHTYHVINLDGTQNHSSCWYSSGNWISDNHLYIFDPNIGEFRTGATREEAGAFFAKLLQEYAGQGEPNEFSRVNVYKATIDTSRATQRI